MNNKQYKNIINYTIATETDIENKDTVEVVRDVLNNCGVPFPSGTKEEIKETLSSGNYIGWTECSSEEAQLAADAGYATVGINDIRAFVIEPSQEVDTMSASIAVETGNNVSTVSELSKDEIGATTFYAQTNFTTDDSGSITPTPSGTTTPTEYYVITYNTNNGTGDFPTQYKAAGQIVRIHFATPYRAGYTFLYWVDSFGNTYAPGTLYIADASTTLTAFWDAPFMGTIHYNLNGGNGCFPEQSAPCGNAITIPCSTPTHTNYPFMYWTDENENIYYPGDAYTVTGTHTLTAQWMIQQITHTLAFNLDGGVGVFPSITQTANTIITLTEEPTRMGYIFVKWRNNYGEEFYTNDLYPFIYGDDTLTAVWECDPICRVTYFLNGGTGDFEPQYGYETLQITIYDRIPERDGYTFVKWKDAAADADYQPGDTISLENGSVTLTAMWNFTGYIISYDVNGGIGDIDTQIKQHNVDLPIFSETPVRVGYNFKHWKGIKTNVELKPDKQHEVSYCENQSDVLLAIWEPFSDSECAALPSYIPQPHGQYRTYVCSNPAVCNDGVGDDHGDVDNHLGTTAYMNGTLHADLHRYIVLPTDAENYWDLLGCVGVALRNNGTYVFGVVGDGGPPKTFQGIIDEYSVKMIQELGYNTDGGTYVSPEAPVATFVFPETKRNTWPAETLDEEVARIGRQYFY